MHLVCSLPGDGCTHLNCTVIALTIDPMRELGVRNFPPVPAGGEEFGCFATDS